MKSDVAIPTAATQVLCRLVDAGFDSYLVGGAVRDLLLGRAIHDIDIATEATPNEVKQIFSATIDTGIRHGTISVRSDTGVYCEVTTFRHDGPYEDGRRPAYVSFTGDIHADLARRDFTINAMAMTKDGEVIDPFGGQADLHVRQLRTVGDPQQRFREDGLRLLRLLRFASTYELNIEKDTFDAFQLEASAIQSVACERIGPELLKLAAGRWPTRLHILSQANIWSFMPKPLPRLGQGFQALLGEVGLVQADVKDWPKLESAIATWCLGMAQGPDVARDICIQTALGRKMANRASIICSLAKQLSITTENPWPPSLLYGTQRDDARAAAAVASWVQRDRQDDISRTVERAIRGQPLWSAVDLAVGGRDILALGGRDRQIGLILNTLIRDVLDGLLQNDTQTLMRAASRLLGGEER